MINNTYKTKCAICGAQSKNTNGLTQHLNTKHNISYKDYYDKYVDNTQHICPICRINPRKFRNISVGYTETCCCLSCTAKMRENTYLENTGFSNPSKNPVIKNKKRETTLSHYGVDNPLKLKSSRENANSTENNLKRSLRMKEYFKKLNDEERLLFSQKRSNTIKNLPESLKEIRSLKISEALKNRSEEQKKLSYEKAKKTKLQRYGSETYNNRKKFIQTSIKRYGVVNSGGSPQSVIKIQKTKFERYGNKSYVNPELAAQTNIKRYGTKSPIQFYKGGGKISKLNKRIYRLLNEMHIYFIAEFILKNGDHNRFYDIKFNNNIILEINGDRVHANPMIYKNPLETIRMQTYSFTVQDKWKDDKEKRELAEKNGFKIVYLWEKQIKEMKDEEIKLWLKNNCNV